MASTNRNAQAKMTAEIRINGEKIAIDSSDIDGVEWRDIKRATAYPGFPGFTPAGIFSAAQQADLEAVVALVWIIKRRDDPNLIIEDVLRTVTLASFMADDEDAPEDSPEDGEANPSG